MSNIITLYTLCLLSISASADAVRTFVSPPSKVILVEVYTSEGCSSCPPADAWLSRFKARTDLWQGVVPLGFHVDYWDYLGWGDRFAKAEFSDRQRAHRATGNIDAVYTPGIVVDGREWRGFFKRRELRPADNPDKPGTLRLTMDDGSIRLTFERRSAGPGPWAAHLAWLGFDLENTITRGENAGKILGHDFVVLEHLASEGLGSSWTFAARPPEHAGAVAAWITQ
ncbi:MAG: DUF1223 domain-containing protein, partial [Pseudomonadales bacterium]|nr:DUF1223 domain-containing protein [Pseudomonadales bacterium]